MKSISPLRYPGGKSVLYDYMKEIISINHLQNHTYVELFAGGAGSAIALLLNGDVKNIIINDYDYCIYSFWHSVLFETEALCQMIQNIQITIEERETQKNVYDHYRDFTTLQAGFATLFLNRTNRSGILQGGVIGGKDQAGDYKLDCRFNKRDIIQRIQRIAEKRDHILIFNMDAGEFLRTQKACLRKWCFFYLDPPYVIKGGNLYKNAFRESDHQKLAEIVKERLGNRKWIMTYDKVDLIERLYSAYSSRVYDLSYTAQEKKIGSEIMIFSKAITVSDKAIIRSERRKPYVPHLRNQPV